MAKARAVAKKRQNFIVRFFRETVAELRKVNWPTREEALRLTGIVLVVIVFTSSLLGVLDFLFTRLFGWIIGA